MQTVTATQAPAPTPMLPQYAPAKDAPKAGVKPRKGRRRDRQESATVRIAIEDPWPECAPAFLRSPPKQAQTLSDEDREWIVPPKKPIEGDVSKRDVIAGMYSRGQIDGAMLLGARRYGSTYATAMALPVKTIDPSAPVVSGGGKGGNNNIEAVSAASDDLKRFEARLARDHGAEAVTLVRAVLVRGLTIEKVARMHGETAKMDAKHWGWLLRRSLQALAEVTGYAVRGAYRNRKREEDRIERERKRRERKDREHERPREGKR